LNYNELENPPYVGSSTELKRAAAGQSYIPNENVPLFLDFITRVKAIRRVRQRFSESAVASGALLAVVGSALAGVAVVP